MNHPSLFDEDTRGRVRANDPGTSWAAARLPGKTTLKARCLAALQSAGGRGLTDFELADAVGRQQTSAGKRRGELVTDGLVVATDRRRQAPSGAMAIVWQFKTGSRLAAEAPDVSQENR